jgi:hypothetical protein
LAHLARYAATSDAAPVPGAAALPGSAAHRHPIRVGSVTIPPCKVSRLAWCTRINVPLDYRDPAAGHIKLGFQWYPATKGKAKGTILAVQGGPGYPTTDYAADYRGTFLPLLTARYATMLRSVTLDAAYPVSGKDPFYPHMIQTARRAFDISCFRSVACHRAAPGSAWARLSVLAAYLRHHPVTGRTRDPFGKKVTERVTTIKLSEMVNDAGSDNGVYRELDAAGRALLDDHDPQPLLRLTEQDIYTGDSGPVREFNAGLYQATTCLGYPQPFSYSQTPAERAARYARAVAAPPAGMFSRFTVHEWVTEPEEEFDTCLDWPVPAHPDPPITTPPPYAPRNLPVLVLSGDLDSLTTPPEGIQTARDMGPPARWILVHNDTHVNAMDDPVGCGSGLVQTFIRDPGRLTHMNESGHG